MTEVGFWVSLVDGPALHLLRLALNCPQESKRTYQVLHNRRASREGTHIYRTWFHVDFTWALYRLHNNPANT